MIFMKREKEIHWIVNLLNNPKLYNSIFEKGGGCIKDFEKTANNSEKDKEFRQWFKYLFEEDIIKVSSSRENLKGKPTVMYVLDKSRMLEYMRTFDFYKKLSKVIVIIEE